MPFGYNVEFIYPCKDKLS